MATNAPVAPLQGFGLARFEMEPSQEQNWRQLFLSEDAELIWHKLSGLVQSSGACRPNAIDEVTQSVFLELLASDWIEVFLRERWTEEAINARILSSLEASAM